MFRVVKKLKMLKEELKLHHSKSYKGNIVEAEADRENLAIAQAKLQLNPSDRQLQQEEREVFVRFKKSTALV